MKYLSAIALFVSVQLLGCQKAEKKSTEPVNSQAPTLELFVMSQCPYGVQAVDAVAQAKEQLGADLNVKIGFIGDGVAGSLTSMHGPSEVKGDLAQVCAIHQAPDKYLAMMTCQNQNFKAADTNWKECADKVGMDSAKLATCTEGSEGQTLLAAAFAEAKARGATGSPTIYLAGKPYEGGRKPKDFVKAVCDSAGAKKPAACANIPVPPVVNAILLSDKRCKECDIGASIEPRLKGELGGLVLKQVDYMTPEGKALFDELQKAEPNFKTLPALLLSPDVEKDKDGYATLQRFLRPVGSYRELQLGGNFDPTAEICDNKTDDDGDSKADCADDGCKNAMTCRPAKPGTLDLFVMSQCPYGAKAMIAAQELLTHFGSEATLNVHFIGDEKGGELTSMHGPEEVAEDIRELCAVTKYAKNNQYINYLACRSKDYKNPDWKPCATEAKLDPAVIQKCYDGEGKKLLAQSFAFSKSLGIGGSPTWIANNQRQFGGIAASEIQKEYCQDNPTLAKCKDAIVSAMPAAGGGEAPAGQCN